MAVSVISVGGTGDGTVVRVDAGTGLSISGDATQNPTVNIASTHKLPTTTEWSGKQDTITSYVKSGAVSDNTLTLTNKDDTTTTYTPIPGRGVLLTSEGTSPSVTVTTDSTKGVSPYNTGYGYTNLTVDTTLVPLTEAQLANGTTVTIQLKDAVASSFRNVRVRFGSTGNWIPVFQNNAILAGNSFLSAHNARHFIYSTGIHTAGAFHMMADSNSTYSPAGLGFGYATCATETATAEKAATLSSYSLVTGGIVSVKFTNAVNANATLNVNTKGAKSIYYKGAAITDGIIKAGDVATFIYSSQYHLLAIDRCCESASEAGETVDLSAYNEGDTVPTETALKLANPLNTAKYTDDYYRIVTDTTVEGTRMILFAALNSANGGGGFFVSLPAGTSDWKFSGTIEIAILGYDANNILKIKINNSDKCFKLVEGTSTLSYTEVRKNASQSGDIVLNLPATGGTLALTSDITAPTYQQIITALGYTPMDSALKGANNGVAELGADGKVPSSQLPSYVDDVIEGYYHNGKFYQDSSHTIEITPESGKIYIDLATNKSYRWGGSVYVEISSSLALGETSSTAYRGDRGKEAYEHSLVTSGNPHNVTKSDIGLDSVENKSSATIRNEITGSNVTTALGYTPYNSTNPNRFISGISSSDVTTALGYTPYNSTNPSGYISGITGQQVKDALGYTPYDNTNPNGYISGINSSDVTTALGYTPYNSTNPNNYIDATTTSLNNYYKKSEVDGMVANRFQALIVQSLPTSGISTSTIYMVLQTGQTDIYDEWMYISNAWTKIGTTSIDMTDYAKKEELHNVALTGAYSSLVGKPTIPEDTADLSNSAGYITKAVNNLDNYTLSSDLATVATSGNYSDLNNTPTIPTALGTLTNDIGYIKQSDLATTNISSLYNDVPYATLNEIQGLKDIDVEEIKKAIAAMEHIGTVTQVTAGTGLTGGGNTSVTLNHANSVTAKSGYPTGTTLVNGGSFTVRDTQYDAQGHITGTQDRVITMEEIPAYNDTAVRGLIQDNADDITALDTRVTAQETYARETFTSFVFCIFGIEPYIDPSTMQIVPNRYYQRSDVDTGIFMDNHKVDIHLKAWLKYKYGIEDINQLKNITCYVYAIGDHGEYVNHMVTFWSQATNPDITSYPHLQQVGSFIDDGYGSVKRFSTTQVGAILSSSDDGYVAADPLGTGKGYVSGWNTLTGRVTDVETNKQAKLTAGTNISIDENNVISATGSGSVTSVSAGTGLNISGDATINPTVNVANTHKLPTLNEWDGKQNTLTSSLVDVVNGTSPASNVEIWIDESTASSEVYNLGQGSPLVASSVSEMTDTNRLYVLTPGQQLYAYKDGAWYDTGMTYSGTEVKQTTGSSSTATMSQQAITNSLAQYNQLDNMLVQGNNSYFYVDTATGAVSVVGIIDVYYGVGGQYRRFQNRDICTITGVGSESILYIPSTDSFVYGDNQTDGVIIATTLGQKIYPKGEVEVRYSDNTKLKTKQQIQAEVENIGDVNLDAWLVGVNTSSALQVNTTTGQVSVIGSVDVYYSRGAKYKRIPPTENICTITGGGTSALRFLADTNTIVYGDSASTGIVIATTRGKQIYPKGEVKVIYTDGTSITDTILPSHLMQSAVDSNSERITALEGGGASLPTFARTAGEETYQRILDWAGDDQVCMIAQVTDVHSAGTEKYRAVSYLGELNSLFGFDLVGNFGDIGIGINGELATEANQLVRNTKMSMRQQVPWIYMKGNHDTGIGITLSDDKLSTIFEQPFAKQCSRIHESGKCYGYVDLEYSKVRAIYLNTSDSASNAYAISATQLNWLVSTLAGMQANWNVVILSHLCVDDCGRWASYPGDASGAYFDTLRSILAAFVAKTNGSNTTTGVSWDFRSVPASSKLVCSFAGDSHFNNTAVTNNVRYVVRQGYGSISSSEIPSGGTVDSFDYTSQVLFDVLCIKADGNAKVFRIGAGGDTRDLAFTF